MTNRHVLAKLHAVAKQLEKASRWTGSPFVVDALKDDYVFELLCLFDIALSKGSMKASVVSREDPEAPGKWIARWPKKPAEMRNFSYLKLSDGKTGEVLFRLCPGINIEDKYKKKRAPDVNLLKEGKTEEPKHTDLLACWDAKFVSDPTQRLSDVAVADFIYTFGCLGSPGVHPRWSSEVTEGRYRVSGLVTNGRMSTEPHDALSEAGIHETAQFPGAPLTRP